MFEKFERTYTPTAGQREEVEDARLTGSAVNADELIRIMGGTVYDFGLYRFCTPQLANRIAGWIGEDFPNYARKILPFAFDWLGRVWGTTLGDIPQHCKIYMVEPGVDVFEVPSTFSDFHDGELSNYKEDDLLASLFNEWRESTTNSELRYNECVGYKVPPILGGDLSVENLELTDFAVNWSLMSQISKRATELPPGTTIGQIRIDDE